MPKKRPTRTPPLSAEKEQTLLSPLLSSGEPPDDHTRRQLLALCTSLVTTAHDEKERKKLSTSISQLLEPLQKGSALPAQATEHLTKLCRQSAHLHANLCLSALERNRDINGTSLTHEGRAGLIQLIYQDLMTAEASTIVTKSMEGRVNESLQQSAYPYIEDSLLKLTQKPHDVRGAQGRLASISQDWVAITNGSRLPEDVQKRLHAAACISVGLNAQMRLEELRTHGHPKSQRDLLANLARSEMMVSTGTQCLTPEQAAQIKDATLLSEGRHILAKLEAQSTDNPTSIRRAYRRAQECLRPLMEKEAARSPNDTAATSPTSLRLVIALTFLHISRPSLRNRNHPSFTTY